MWSKHASPIVFTITTILEYIENTWISYNFQLLVFVAFCRNRTIPYSIHPFGWLLLVVFEDLLTAYGTANKSSKGLHLAHLKKGSWEHTPKKWTNGTIIRNLQNDLNMKSLWTKNPKIPFGSFSGSVVRPSYASPIVFPKDVGIVDLPPQHRVASLGEPVKVDGVRPHWSTNIPRLIVHIVLWILQ